jgi:enamine deaminase RidA (YjgF/YER057c/UK114 family)
VSPDAPDAPWRRIDPPDLAPPVGYSYAVESGPGRRLTIAGQVAMDRGGDIVHRDDIVGQAGLAFANLASVLEAAGAKPGHLVRMRIFVTDIAAYQAAGKAIGRAYRSYFGRWYPAMTLVQVSRLYDDGALIEVEGEAVIP